MSIFMVVLAFSAHYLVYFLMKYCLDTPTTWADMTDDNRLYVPCVDDVKFREDESISLYRIRVNRYVNQVVCPAHHYFALNKKLCKRNDSAPFYISAFLMAVSAFVAYKKLGALSFIQSDFRCFTATGCICILGDWAVRFLYNRRFALPKITVTMEEMTESFNRTYSPSNYEYDIAKETAFNNYLILKHLDYLIKVEDSVRRRQCAETFLSIAAAVIFLLFVPFNP